MIGGTAIARRYARAVFGLGEGDPSRTAALLEEFQTLTDEILASDELRRSVLTPLFPRAERQGVIDELVRALGLSAEIRATATVLVNENRMLLLPVIRDELQALVDEMAGRVEARVSSARPLGEQQQEQLREALSRRVGADVTLDVRVDPELIGGVVARIGDLLLDGSVRTQLENLGASLRKGSA